MSAGIHAQVPSFLHERWRTAKPTKTTNFLNLGHSWGVPDLLAHVPKNVEAGGVVFPAGVSIQVGDCESVFTSPGLCTWHSHTEGPCRFSLQDWCSFIQSISVWSLLITPSHYRVYTKRDCVLLRKCEKYLSGYSRQIPSMELMGRRLKKFASNNSDKRNRGWPDDLCDIALGEATGIDIGPEYNL